MSKVVTYCINICKIIFDVSKQELGNPGSNFKKFVKKYKEAYKVSFK